MRKYLKAILINSTEEYYLINFVVVTLFFTAFHIEGAAEFFRDIPYVPLLGCAVFIIAFQFVAWRIATSNKKHNSDTRMTIVVLPLAVTTYVSIISLVVALNSRVDGFETMISTLFLLFYGLRALLIYLYLLLDRLDAKNTKIYKNIDSTLESAVGDYQVTLTEVFVGILAVIVTLGVLRNVDINPYTEFLVTFSVAGGVSSLTHLLRKGTIQ